MSNFVQGTNKEPIPSGTEFTRQQLEYLERIFPEVLSDAKTVPSEVLYQTLGQRQVIAHVRKRVR